MIEVYTGNPSAGKTTYLARIAYNRLKENKALFDKHEYLRTVRCNIKFSDEINEEYKDFIEYFSDLEDIDTLRHSDLIIDELSLFFDSHNWEALPRRTKKFLRLHRHYGVNIFSATQDFKSVDPSFRRLVDNGNLYMFDRVVASREPIEHLPPISHPYLFTIMRKVKATSYADEKIEYRYVGMGSWKLFRKKDFFVFDTHQDFDLGAVHETSPGYHDLVKVQRVCQDDGYVKVSYK